VKKSIAGAAVEVDGLDAPHHEHSEGVELHTWIGIALVLGFTFMLLVDQIGGSPGHTHGGNSVGKYLTKQTYVQVRKIWFL
jgi:zinc transporter 9